MGAPKKADWREERRKRAWKLKEEGWQQKDIAVALGVSEGAVSHWIKRGREGGEEARKRACTQRSKPAVNGGTESADTCVVSQRGRGVWVSRRCVDGEPGGRSDQTHLWGALSPRSCWATDAGSGLESTEAGGASQSKERRGHQTVVGRALAGN